MKPNPDKSIHKTTEQPGGRALLSILFLADEIKALRKYIRHIAVDAKQEDIDDLEQTIAECRAKIAQHTRKIKGMTHA